MDVFASVKEVPPNPIFDLTTRFMRDTSPKKLNLGVGAYRDHFLRPYVFDVVKRAKDALHAADLNHEYLPIVGEPTFRAEAAKLVFGSGSAALADKSVATIQSLSGTGALCLAFEFLMDHKLVDHVYLPNPTWGNHKAIAEAAGFDHVESYPYYDPVGKGLDFDGMMAALAAFPPRSAVVLQVCAHNPTGVDPSPAQWEALLEVCAAHSLVPVMDFAYQGFASGDPDRDAFPVRHCEGIGLNCFVAQSFAKNMGLYSERIGALHVLCASQKTASAVLSNLALVARRSYSNPPAFGARVVGAILSHADQLVAWRLEIRAVVARIDSMRLRLRRAVEAAGVRGTWDHITTQIGMFTFTGVPKDAVATLVESHHVYMLANGRVNMAGLCSDTIPLLVDALASVLGANPARSLPAPPRHETAAVEAGAGSGGADASAAGAPVAKSVPGGAAPVPVGAC